MAERVCVNCGQLWVNVNHNMKWCAEPECQNAKADAVSVRRRSSANRERCRENARRVYRENRSQRVETKRRWRAENPEKVQGYLQKYRQSNRDLLREKARRYVAKLDPIERRQYQAQRRERERTIAIKINEKFKESK